MEAEVRQVEGMVSVTQLVQQLETNRILFTCCTFVHSVPGEIAPILEKQKPEA